MPQYRQGDVFIVSIPSLPSDTNEVQPDENGNLTLAYGEVTGHHHSFRNLVKGTSGVKMFRDSSGGMYLNVMKPTALIHEEHSPIVHAPGIYKVIGQREGYSPESIRRVSD